MRSKHQAHINDLENRLYHTEVVHGRTCSRYEQIQKNYVFAWHGKTWESDLIAVLGDILLLFEYKSTDSDKHRTRAIQQLYNAKDYWENLCYLSREIKLFYVHDDQRIEWIKDSK